MLLEGVNSYYHNLFVKFEVFTSVNLQGIKSRKFVVSSIFGVGGRRGRKIEEIRDGFKIYWHVFENNFSGLSRISFIPREQRQRDGGFYAKFNFMLVLTQTTVQ